MPTAAYLSPWGRPPRVLHVGKFYHPQRGGIESHLRSLCEGLKGRVEVEVLVAAPGRRTRFEVVDGIPVTRCATWFAVSSAGVCPGMVRAIRRARPDLVHIHLPNPAAQLALFASGFRGPCIVGYHGDITRQRMLGKAYAPFLHKTLDRCEALIASSQNYLESSPVLSRYRERCRVIPYGIPLEPYGRADVGAVSAIRERYGPRIVLSVGRLVYYKGFEHLVRAMEAIEARLLIIGDGPLRPLLEAEARRRGIDERVVFLGEVEDPIPYYHAAEVFALASTERSESFGIVQLEAMACGKPVVNTRLESGVPFVSLHGLTGLTVPPRDPGALAAAINRLLGDPALRETYGRQARRRVETEFTREKMVERTLALYRQVMP